MKKTLVKYVNAESTKPQSEFIKAVHVEDPSSLVKMLKEVDYIEINEDYYTFESSAHKVPKTQEELDVVYVFLDDMNI